MDKDEVNFVNDFFGDKNGFKEFAKDLDKLKMKNKNRYNDLIADDYMAEIEEFLDNRFITDDEVDDFFEKHKSVIDEYEHDYIESFDPDELDKQQVIEMTLKEIAETYLNEKYGDNE